MILPLILPLIPMKFPFCLVGLVAVGSNIFDSYAGYAVKTV